MEVVNEIFKTNKKLLEEPEVKELIKYASQTYSNLYESYRIKQEKEFKVLDICMNSDVVMQGGNGSRVSIESILELYNED